MTQVIFVAPGVGYENLFALVILFNKEMGVTQDIYLVVRVFFNHVPDGAGQKHFVVRDFRSVAQEMGNELFVRDPVCGVAEFEQGINEQVLQDNFFNQAFFMPFQFRILAYYQMFRE